MKTALFAVIVTLTWIAQAAASTTQPPVPLPEPGTLALLSIGAAAATFGARWFRRK